jgi:hypothetical protein
MSTYLDQLANGKGNPLLQQLIDFAQSKGGLTVGEVLKFVEDSTSTASNLYRIGTDGIPRTTGVVALYSKAFTGAEGDRLQVGNLAQDMSLRSPDVVAIDTTATGRLLKFLDYVADSRDYGNGLRCQCIQCTTTPQSLCCQITSSSSTSPSTPHCAGIV